MGKQAGMPEGIRTTMFWVLGIGIIALIGLIMLILFGNLAGNVGFDQDSTTFYNHTINLSSAGEIPDGAVHNSTQMRVSATLSSIIVTNASTGGARMTSDNYTVTGTTINASSTASADYNHNVNVSATVTYDSQGQIDSDNLILNYSKSVINISKQFPTIGTMVGVALLLVILIGILIFAIRKMMGISDVGGGGFEGGKSKRFSGSDSAGIA